MNARPRVLSGIQPTADSFHIGNYLGALQYWPAMQDTHDCFYSVVDLHAFTVATDPQVMHQRTLVSYAQLIATGIDPGRSALFVQSHVPEHAELMWMLSCLTGFGEAGRMTQFKDKSSKAGADSTNVGLFTYPILQAADILIYGAHEVPVGEDQRQHLELSRDLAQRFNKRYGRTLVVPNPHIIKDTAKIGDLQDPGAKMSKSSPTGVVNLLDPLKTIEKRIKSAVTDSETDIRFDPVHKPGVSNLLSIIAGFTGKSVDTVAADLQGRMYGDLKKEAATAVLAFAEPFQTEVNELLADRAELERLMAEGAAKAHAVAAVTLAAVYDAVGFVRGRSLA
jgi:tryptophanyl-tRNA synthetase